MERSEILNEIQGSFGSVPGWLKEMPDAILAQQWEALKWAMSDTKMSMRDKALVSFGAATAAGCQY